MPNPIKDWFTRNRDSALRERFQHALQLHQANEHARAEAEYRAVLAARNRRGQPNHSDALSARNNLALLLGIDGRADEGAAIAESVTETYARNLGTDHPDTLLSRSNLGLIRHTQGRFDEAAVLHESVLASRIRVLGPDVEQCRESRLHLAQALSRLGRWAEAETHARTIVDELTALRGATHVETLQARNILADLLGQHDKHDAAMAEFTAVIDAVAADHPVTLAARVGRASELSFLARYDEAELETRQAITGNRQVDDAARVFLAQYRAARGDLDGAEAELRGLAAGSNSAVLAFATVLIENGKAGEAAAVLTGAVADLTRTRGDHDSATLCARHILGTALVHIGRLDEAEAAFRATLARADRPPTHSCSLTCRQGLADIAVRRGQLDLAAEEHAAVLAGLLDCYGERHPDTLDGEFRVAEVLALRGEHAAACEAHRAVLEKRIEVLGADHPDTRKSRDALRTP